VYFVEDVSRELSLAEERDQLENKVRELTLTDELTGLPNRRALGSALAAQVTRSRRYHNPLAMAMVRPTCGLGDAAPPDAVMLAVSRFLRDRLRWADIIGREDEQTFMLILPETDQVAANGVIQQIRDEVSAVRLPPPHESRQLKLSIGLAQWRRGLDGAGLVAEARQGLAAA
jgi:PleD family two-component response regulator